MRENNDFTHTTHENMQDPKGAGIDATIETRDNISERVKVCHLQSLVYPSPPPPTPRACASTLLTSNAHPTPPSHVQALTDRILAPATKDDDSGAAAAQESGAAAAQDVHLTIGGSAGVQEESKQDSVEDRLLSNGSDNAQVNGEKQASSGADAGDSDGASATAIAAAAVATITTASTTAAAATPSAWLIETLPWRKLAAEAVGTGMIVLFGCGSVCATMSGACECAGVACIVEDEEEQGELRRLTPLNPTTT